MRILVLVMGFLIGAGVVALSGGTPYTGAVAQARCWRISDLPRIHSRAPAKIWGWTVMCEEGEMPDYPGPGGE